MGKLAKRLEWSIQEVLRKPSSGLEEVFKRSWRSRSNVMHVNMSCTLKSHTHMDTHTQARKHARRAFPQLKVGDVPITWQTHAHMQHTHIHTHAHAHTYTGMQTITHAIDLTCSSWWCYWNAFDVQWFIFLLFCFYFKCFSFLSFQFCFVEVGQTDRKMDGYTLMHSH